MDRVDNATALVDHEDIVVHNCCRTLFLSQRFDGLYLAKWPVTTPSHNDKIYQVIESFLRPASFLALFLICNTIAITM